MHPFILHYHCTNCKGWIFALDYHRVIDWFTDCQTSSSCNFNVQGQADWRVSRRINQSRVNLVPSTGQIVRSLAQGLLLPRAPRQRRPWGRGWIYILYANSPWRLRRNSFRYVQAFGYLFCLANALSPQSGRRRPVDEVSKFCSDW